MSIELFKQYLLERENTELISTEQGFITYRFEPEYCYIIDIYVLPEHRKSGLGVKLEEMVIVRAKEKGYNKLLGSVDLNANNYVDSLAILERINYKQAWQDGSTLYLIKGI